MSETKHTQAPELPDSATGGTFAMTVTAKSAPVMLHKEAPPKLEDLTRDQLLLLIRNRNWQPEQREVNAAVWDDMENKARTAREEALARTKKAPTTHQWLVAQNDFTDALALSDEAAAFFSRWVVPKEPRDG